MIKDDKKLGEMELNTYTGKHLLNKEEFNNLTNDIVRSNMKYICDECNVTLRKEMDYYLYIIKMLILLNI